ncbi:putative mediator of RNA polymerase II transcription subunit 12 [Anopheles stephensi]|uniref:putative mediator of RNA polymerase II transcription subunit 12 n=1 Tax=Anopheles stephensi TaxID=30069 RepID=UPI001658824A|nr:putative mediator of RNA polymerase II transcription subunit 12 [Anopheles stephensi]
MATNATVRTAAEIEQDYQESDKTRASNPEDFPNFRDFQIVKMVQHFRVVTDGSQEQLRLGFKCKTCGVTFNKTMQLLGHIRLHFEDEHTCRNCGKYFFDPSKLQIHIRAKHTTNMLKCQLGCLRYSAPSLKCLQLHYERFHYVKIRMRELRKMDEAIRNGGTVVTEIVSKKQRRKQLLASDLLRSASSGEESQGAEGPYEEEAEEQSPQEQVQEEPQPVQPAQPIQLQQIQIQQPQLIQQQHQLPQHHQYVIQTVESVEEEDDGFDDDDEGSEKLQSEQPAENALYDDQMQCCVCGAIFEEESQLEMHENSHTAPLECSFCGMTFLQLSDVRQHYQSRHQAVSRPSSQYVISHPSGTLVQQQQPQQPQALHQIVHNPHQLQQDHQQTASQQLQPAAQFIPSASNGAMTTMLVMQNGMLIPVHAIDSAQLTAVNPYQHQTAPIAQGSQIAWPITATPIAATHQQQQQHQQQILPPVHNQIEIIPLHTSPAAGASVAPHHSIITSITPQQLQQQQQQQGQPAPQTLTPIQLSIKDASGNVAGANGTGGFVINQIASIDPSYLKQIDPVLHQQQQQQQQQPQSPPQQPQSQQIHHQWQQPFNSS